MVALRILVVLFLAMPASARTLSRYALLLQDPPAAMTRSIIRTGGVGPEVAALRNRQRPLRDELRRRGIHVTGAAQTLINAVFVAADPSRIAELQSLPGVRRVVFLPPVRPMLDKAEQLVNLPGAWDLFGGMSQAGAGVKIAVIDSGIDDTHPAFVGTAPKVVVARSYIRQQGAGDPADPAKDSRPDDFTPRDHQGHGTAVGMIIAGITTTGPGDTITGFAPAAQLGSYKVFGTTGVNDGASEDTIILALEDAQKDGMDIANLSLGGPAIAGPLDTGDICLEPADSPCDPLALAIENATRLGLLVVTAGGNEGATGSVFPTLATASTPGIAPSAISVAASTNSHQWIFGSNGWTSLDTTGNTVANFSSRGPAIANAAIKPDLAAPGTSLFLAAQNYDPTGDLYSSTRFTVSQGTSFSAPMVAGAAALVKQSHPAWLPWQIKSALMNTATQDITDRGQPASVTAVGSGKMNVAAAVATNLTVNPQSASFGIPSALPVTQSFEIRNSGTAAVDLQITVEARTQDANTGITLTPAALTVAAGQSAQFTASLTGNMPSPGSYEGFIVLRSNATTLRIPYLYAVSDGVPANAVPLLGDGGIGLVGGDIPDGIMAFEIIDRYGLPVPNVPATFAASLGGGQIVRADAATNKYGIATAEATLGPTQNSNVFTGSAGAFTLRFSNNALAQPTIADGGVVNAAGFQAGPGIAPGEYISIFGSGLALTSSSSTTARLPLALRNVSVSFDVPEAGLSLPGHLIFVSQGQVNVQVPWELQGQKSVQIKVSISTASGKVITVPVADSAPGLFTAVQNTGQTITLYASGLGPVIHPPASGDPAPDATSTTVFTPTVTIGGIAARVVFSGLAPGYAGLYQVNVEVPEGIPAGTQPVTLSVNNVAANPIQVPLQ